MRTRCLSYKLLVIASISAGFTSCKTRSNPSELREIWFNLLDTKWKAAQEVSDRNEYIRTFSVLPLKGVIQPAPWPGSIYPDEMSGLDFRALSKKKFGQYPQEAPASIKDTTALSAMEKYDLLAGHAGWESTLAENRRTDNKGRPIDPTKSLDQDWAAASILFAEPQPFKAATDAGVRVNFEASDIKGLLTLFLKQNSLVDNGVETRSLGGVCRLDSDSLRRALQARTFTANAWKDMKNDECFAVNAGAFHLALANILGLRQESFVLDPHIDLEFTHYPLLSYQSEILGTPVPGEGGHQEVQIKTQVTFVMPAASGATRSVPPVLKSETYRYKLELDEEGDIVGGNWLNTPVPQFAWIQNRPRFGAADASLEKLYTSSVSLPSRMAMRNFAAIDSEDPEVPVRDVDGLVVNKKYRLELNGDAPRGADGLKTFLQTAFRSVGLVTIYRNTFADEDALISIEVQFHSPTTFRALKQAIKAHSNNRSEVVRILR